MAIFRQYIAPLIVVLVFLVALLAVSVRIFIPEDMAAPAPTEEVGQQTALSETQVASVPSTLDVLVHGLPEGAIAAPSL